MLLATAKNFGAQIYLIHRQKKKEKRITLRRKSTELFLNKFSHTSFISPAEPVSFFLFFFLVRRPSKCRLNHLNLQPTIIDLHYIVNNTVRTLFILNNNYYRHQCHSLLARGPSCISSHCALDPARGCLPFYVLPFAVAPVCVLFCQNPIAHIAQAQRTLLQYYRIHRMDHPVCTMGPPHLYLFFICVFRSKRYEQQQGQQQEQQHQNNADVFMGMVLF